VSQWLSNTLLPTVLAGAVLLLVLWPTERSGRRLLESWGIPRPRPDQVWMAIRYLWQRRILYVVLFLAVPSLAELVLRNDANLPDLSIFAPLLAAMLIAELVATLRPVGGVRVASLDPRGWRDLVPRWAVVAAVVLVVCVVAWSVAGLVLQATFTSWLALGSATTAVVLTVLLVRLAVRRPAVDDEEVDAALRARTARVAVGIGVGWLGAAVLMAVKQVHHLYIFGPPEPSGPGWLYTASGWFGMIALLTAIGCWIWVANPSRRALAKVHE
jgi:hypothetical protein